MAPDAEGGGPGSPQGVGAVLLAAGSGSRIGTRPKSLLELGGVPLIRRQLGALSGAGVDEVVVVLGHHAEAIAPALQALAVTIVRNPRPDDGQVSSQRIGLAALTGRLDAVIVALAKSGTEIAKGEVLNEPVLTVVPSEMEYCRSTVLTERVPIPEIRSDCAAERPVTLLMVKTSD